jgi:hypothetical protein
MKLYVVVFEREERQEIWSEPYLAYDFDSAEAHCREENPSDIKIIHTARIPFHMVERAYYLGKPR